MHLRHGRSANTTSPRTAAAASRSVDESRTRPPAREKSVAVANEGERQQPSRAADSGKCSTYRVRAWVTSRIRRIASPGVSARKSAPTRLLPHRNIRQTVMPKPRRWFISIREPLRPTLELLLFHPPTFDILIRLVAGRAGSAVMAATGDRAGLPTAPRIAACLRLCWRAPTPMTGRHTPGEGDQTAALFHNAHHHARRAGPMRAVVALPPS